MTEYINKAQFRQKLIDRQITTQFFNPRERHEIGCIIEMLDNTPGADVVEVVRCKDCKYLSKNKFYCGRWKYAILDNGFCNHGERKEDNE